MTNAVLEIEALNDRDWLATQISHVYGEWRNQMHGKMEEWGELRNYLFATSTQDTTNSNLPWKNTTTVPKLTQIRDNLHANYMDALFPNDTWMKWEGDNDEAELADKRAAIEYYMLNKTRNGGFRETVSKLLYDYIDYGNVIADVEYVHEEREDPLTGEITTGYVGPRLVRRSPLDTVVNPTALSFDKSPKITRSIKTFGDLEAEAQDMPELAYRAEALDNARNLRSMFMGFDHSDTLKNAGYSVDGFGSLMEYYRSPYVEILEFEGDIRDKEGTLLRNQLITIIDRSYVLRITTNPSWSGGSTMVHTGWRPRPDNLWAMGPLDNLVGMQYRIDHLENIKADLFDLIAHPPVKIKGNVEAFEWAPFSEIFLGDDGEVDILKVDATALNADTQIAILEQRMEEMAGAPREAMGIRTPGEKTAFEVQALGNAAGRIFNNRIRNFEINIIEKILNHMLEVARRNIDATDLIRVMDDDIGVVEFLNITKDDITAKGKLRPMGARHYAATSQLVQNLQGVFNSPIGGMIAPHISSKSLAKVVEEAFGWERFDLVSDNAGIMEQMETQRLVQTGEDQLATEAITPTDV